jgi:type III secretory pathway component EscT
MIDIFSSIGAGLPEKDAKYRYLATIVTLVIGFAAVSVAIGVQFVWPFWAALPAGIVALGVGGLAIYGIVGRILPQKTGERRDEL